MDHRSKAKQLGRQARDAGMMLAALRKQRSIVVDSVALLEAMLSRDDLTATTDDTVGDLVESFNDGGKWRGSITRRLANQGTIHRVGYVPSCRSSRHSGTVSEWQGKDRPTVVAAIVCLRAWLVANPEPVDDRRVGQLELWPATCDPNKKTDPTVAAVEPERTNPNQEAI